MFGIYLLAVGWVEHDGYVNIYYYNFVGILCSNLRESIDVNVVLLKITVFIPTANVHVTCITPNYDSLFPWVSCPLGTYLPGSYTFDIMSQSPLMLPLQGPFFDLVFLQYGWGVLDDLNITFEPHPQELLTPLTPAYLAMATNLR